MDKIFRLSALLPVFMLTACAGLSSPGGSGLSTESSPEAIQINPLTDKPNEFGDASYDMLVAEMALNRGQTDLAIKHYLSLAKRQNNPAIAERAVRIAVYGQDLEAAVESAQRWLELEPGRSEAQQIIAAIYIRKDQVEEAFNYLDSIIIDSALPKRELYGSLLGVLSREKNTETVIAVSRKIADKHSDEAYALYLHAMLSAQHGNPEESLTYFDRSLAFEAIDGAHNARAKVLLKLGRPEEAILSLEKALERKPDNKNLRLTYARLLVDVKQYEKAHSQFEVLYQTSPDDIDLLYTLGLLSLESGRLDDAETYLLKLNKSGQREGETQYYLGRINENRKAFSKAIEWYEKVHIGEYKFDARLRIADLLGQSGKIEEAHRLLKDMLKGSQSNSSLIRIYLAEGELLRSARRYEEAIEVYNTALGIIPGNNDLLYVRALTAEKIDRLDILEADIQAILKTEPDNAHALNALGFTLADRTDRYQEALDYIQRAIQIMPDDPAIMDSLGWVYYRLGRTKESIEMLKKAYSQLDDAEIAAHLGEVLWVDGEKQEAQDIWQEALKKSPEDPTLIEAMDRLIR